MLSITAAGNDESGRVSAEALALPTIGTLLATGAVVSQVCRSPDEPFTSWGQLLVRAMGYVLLAGAVHVAAVWVVCRIYEDELKAPVGRIVRGTWPGVAMLPVAVLLAHAGSVWAAVVLPVIAVTAVLFVRRAAPEAGRLARSGAPAGIAAGLFAYQAPRSLVQALWPMAMVGVMLELGAVMLASWQYALAGLLFGLCGMVVLWRLPLRSASPERQDGRGQVWVSTVMVLVLTIVTLLPSLGGSRMAGMVGRFVGPPVMAKTVVPEANPSGARSGALSGVILTLPPKPREKVVLTRPRSVSAAIGPSARVQTIPFDGAYWYFRRPEVRPRENARRVRGDPTKVDIHSTDMVALAMEAHQRLETPIGTDCCSAIRVSVRNAETREGAIGLELVLGGRGWRRSLGMLMLTSSLRSHGGEAEEVVEFALPRDLSGGVIDELTVVVVMPAGERARRAARVAIESFGLVGR